ncbi:hypothetical protein FSP39_021766 [Pinctada imbricata]|uniref:TIR domain-containing protein n=1 Tax=Pinctada imbricata TaxID=66713 RepID=A0AA88Y6E1_PINIB|nr:hypothetical protein FSP39_021766 [Pinctada imbricata]
MIKTLIFDTRKKTRFRNDSLSCFEKTDIRELKIYGADGAFRPLEADFIRPLHSLESIVVDSFKMLTSYVFSRLLYPLQNRSLDKFYITHTYFDRIERLSGEALEYLPTICIKHLNIHNCQIQDIDFNRLRDSKLWSCLETFKVQENYFSMLGYFFIFTLGLPKISHIDACCQLVRQGTSDDSFDPLLRSSSEVKTQKRLGMLEIFLPNNTKYVSFSDNDLSSNDLGADIFIHGNLEIIQLKNLRLGTCEGRIKGLQKLKVLEIRQWNCQTMNPEFITHLTSITNLSITKSNIGHNAKTFQLIFNLTYLTYLDFSENSFDELHPYFFQSQIQSLTNISFAENSFKAIPKALFVLKNLQFLDFRFNLISRLTSDEITFIDGLNDLKISLGGNALRCSCETLPFLHWVQENSHKIKDYDNLTCLYNNVPYIKISAVIGILHKLEISCISHIWLGISISALICLLLLVFLGFLLYKFQPDVRYVIARFRRTLRKLYQKESGLPLLENMRYHAFVSYGNVNYTWACFDLWDTLTKDGFRLILRDRNFDLGEHESTVILDAIDCSRRVIFVLTHDFLENEWNEYHIQIARLHAFRNETTNFIIVILIDDIPPHEIPKSLQRIWIRVKCLRWPKDGNRRSILSFWDELRNELTMD